MKTTPPSERVSTQREALKQSEKKAAEHQPESFKDVETEQKVVEIGTDKTATPIRGIDPPTRHAARR
jgi:hypothetical protein